MLSFIEDRILFPSSGGTYSVGINRQRLALSFGPNNVWVLNSAHLQVEPTKLGPRDRPRLSPSGIWYSKHIILYYYHKPTDSINLLGS
jgi:hypothetical protein